jgi:hypothetical protein
MHSASKEKLILDQLGKIPPDAAARCAHRNSYLKDQVAEVGNTSSISAAGMQPRRFPKAGSPSLLFARGLIALIGSGASRQFIVGASNSTMTLL